MTASGEGIGTIEVSSKKLRERFSFGAYNEHEFDFCGVHYRQWDDGLILRWIKGLCEKD